MNFSEGDQKLRSKGTRNRLEEVVEDVEVSNVQEQGALNFAGAAGRKAEARVCDATVSPILPLGVASVQDDRRSPRDNSSPGIVERMRANAVMSCERTTNNCNGQQHQDSKLFIVTDEEPIEGLKIVQWEEFENGLAHLCGVVSVKSKLQAKKEALAHKLEAALEVRKASLERIDKLEAMERKLRSRTKNLDDAKALFLQRSEALTRAKDHLLPSACSLLLAAKGLAAAQSRLQEADRLLAGEGGYGRLMQLLKLLAARRRLMATQVASLYPLAPCATTVSYSMQHDHPANSQPQLSDHFSKGNQSSIEATVEKLDSIPMTIGGLHVLAPLNKKPGLYNEKNDYSSSATALGYVAHVVSLVASYLDVPLRYPLRLGASRSYIQDYAPVTEPGSGETGANTAGTSQRSTRRNAIEFPLFSEGQDPTRSAYAVFLLNKDLEQMLNYLDAESIGPRHTLPNLNRLIQLVCSGVHHSS